MKKRILLFILIISLCVLLASCSKENEESMDNSNAYKLYYLDSGDSQLVYENYVPKASSDDELIKEFISALDIQPSNFAYVNAKPADVQITDILLDDEGVLLLNFNTNYKNLSGIKEILCRAALVKTFCQIESVKYVEFYVNNQPLLLADEKPVGIMTSSDFIDHTLDKGEYVNETNVKIYLANESGDMLVESLLIVSNNGLKSQEQLIIEQLIYGPLEDQTNMKKVIADGTKLNSVTTKDGICTVDFSEEFLSLRKDVTAQVAIYSIVNSLVDLPQINKVRFLINGETRKLFSDIDLTAIFERNLELIASEKAGDS